MGNVGCQDFVSTVCTWNVCKKATQGACKALLPRPAHSPLIAVNLISLFAGGSLKKPATTSPNISIPLLRPPKSSKISNRGHSTLVS